MLFSEGVLNFGPLTTIMENHDCPRSPNPRIPVAGLPASLAGPTGVPATTCARTRGSEVRHDGGSGKLEVFGTTGSADNLDRHGYYTGLPTPSPSFWRTEDFVRSTPTQSGGQQEAARLLLAFREEKRFISSPLVAGSAEKRDVHHYFEDAGSEHFTGVSRPNSHCEDIRVLDYEERQCRPVEDQQLVSAGRSVQDD